MPATTALQPAHYHGNKTLLSSMCVCVCVGMNVCVCVWVWMYVGGDLVDVGCGCALSAACSCSISCLSQMIEQLYQHQTLKPRVGQGQYPNNMMTLWYHNMVTWPSNDCHVTLSPDSFKLAASCSLQSPKLIIFSQLYTFPSLFVYGMNECNV